MRSKNSSGLRLSKVRKQYLADYINLTRDKITERDWDYKLWEYMHARDFNIAHQDVKRWIAAHKYMLVPDRDEVDDEGTANNAVMNEHPTSQQGEGQVMSSAVSTSTGIGLRILNAYQLAPTPAPSPRDLAGTGTNSGSSSSLCTANDKASYSPSIAASTVTVKGGDLLDSQCRNMQGTKDVYQSAFDAIKVIHDACMKLPEVKTCLIPLEKISKIFHRNHQKLIFPVRYQAARNSNSRVKVEAFTNNDAYHYHSSQDVCEEIQDVEYLCILPA